eukprot:gene8591-11607_t
MSMYIASQSSRLLASSIDSAEVDELFQNIIDVSKSFNSILNTRASNTVQKYNPELRLLSNIIYYVPKFFNNDSISCNTIGQEYCGLELFNTMDLSKRSGSQKVLRRLQSLTKFKLALLYSILPYLFQRKTIILNEIHKQWNLLVSVENLSNTAPITESNNGAESNTTTTNSRNINGIIVNSSRYDSIFYKLLKAIYSSWVSIGNGNSREKLDIIFKYLHDFHIYFFLKDGLYLEYPLRFMSLYLMANGQPKFSLRLKIFSWLVFFRLLLLSVYGSCVLLQDIDKEINRNVSNQLDSKECETSEDEDELNNGSVSKKNNCPLCLDNIKNPSVIRCGHMFCWKCIVDYSAKVSTQREAEIVGYNSNSKKCPVCRVVFEKQRIRPLFNYS